MAEIYITAYYILNKIMIIVKYRSVNITFLKIKKDSMVRKGIRSSH